MRHNGNTQTRSARRHRGPSVNIDAYRRAKGDRPRGTGVWRFMHPGTGQLVELYGSYSAVAGQLLSRGGRWKLLTS